MTDDNPTPPKRPRGRPKKQPGDAKSSYNLSSPERARRETQRRIRTNRKKAEKLEGRAKRYRQVAREQTRAAGAVENAINGKKSRVIDEGTIHNLPKSVRDMVQDSEVVFKPNDGPQFDFLSAPEQDVLYGGAAGGGKSFALLADPLRYCHNANFRGLLLRRTLDELTELIDKSKQLYPKAFPGATFRESKSTWNFPSGATLWFTYLDLRS